MEIVIPWLLFSLVVGVAANARGRSGLIWFLFSILLSPVVTLLLVLVSKNLKVPQTAVAVNGEVATTETHVRCPECRELVRADARKCKHCGTQLVPQQLSPR
jgi:Na+/H+-dicarboxylate symporter